MYIIIYLFQIDKVNKKMDKAAQRKFKEEVEELKIKKQRQEDNLKTYKDKIDDHKLVNTIP